MVVINVEQLQLKKSKYLAKKWLNEQITEFRIQCSLLSSTADISSTREPVVLIWYFSILKYPLLGSTSIVRNLRWESKLTERQKKKKNRKIYSVINM